MTTILEKVQALLDNFELSAANQVKTYRIAITEKSDILGALDDEILTLIKEEHIEDEIIEIEIFKESIHQMIVQIDEALDAVEVENSGPTDKSISHNPSNSNSYLFTEGVGAGKAKLPKIILKNSMVILFLSLHPGIHSEALSMTILVYQMLINLIT